MYTTGWLGAVVAAAAVALLFRHSHFHPTTRACLLPARLVVRSCVFRCIVARPWCTCGTRRLHTMRIHPRRCVCRRRRCRPLRPSGAAARLRLRPASRNSHSRRALGTCTRVRVEVLCGCDSYSCKFSSRSLFLFVLMHFFLSLSLSLPHFLSLSTL